MRNWLQQRVHCSWHIAWAAAGVLFGVALGSVVRSSVGAPLLFAASILIFLIACRFRFRWLVLGALVAGGLLGLGRAELSNQRSDPLLIYTGQTIQLSGRVTEDPAFGKKGDQRLHLVADQVGSKQIEADVWVSLQTKSDIRRGDTVVVEGMLRSGFGSFRGSMSRAAVIKIVRPRPGDIGIIIRDWFAAGVHRVIAQPEAALGMGYLTGQQTALPPELDEQLQTVGLTHAVVASGYNLTILASFARNVFLQVSRYLSAIFAAGMIVLFIAVAGLSPSMSRAGLVAGIGLLVWYYGRSIHPVILLLFAGAATALYRPSYVWGDLGWYLSFTAFAGVMIIAPLIKRCFWESEQHGLLKGILIETLSAQLATLPIIIYSFGVVAVYALPANMLIVPLIPLAMLLVFMAGIAGLTFPGWASIAGYPAEVLLSYMIGTVRYIANLPGAQAAFQLPVVWLWISYGIMTAAVVVVWRVTGHDFRQVSS